MAKAQALDGADLVPVSNLHAPKTPAARIPSEELVPMQFRMPAEFVRAFKVHAAENDMKLNELLKACFDAFKK